jgi:HEPN domain-containing protein
MSERVEAWKRTSRKHREDAISLEGVSLSYAIYAWQQAAETAIKCAILSTGESFSHVHSLLRLWAELGEQVPLPELNAQRIEDMRNLSGLNTSARYPTGDEAEAHFETLSTATLEMAKRTGEFIFDTLSDVLPEVFPTQHSSDEPSR